jgi:hypothetical protein
MYLSICPTWLGGLRFGFVAFRWLWGYDICLSIPIYLYIHIIHVNMCTIPGLTVSALGLMTSVGYGGMTYISLYICISIPIYTYNTYKYVSYLAWRSLLWVWVLPLAVGGGTGRRKRPWTSTHR